MTRAFGIGRYQETRKPPGAGRFTRCGQNTVKVGNAAIGYPGLFSVRHEMLPSRMAVMSICRHIRTGTRFTQCEGRQGKSSPGLAQPCLLVGCAKQRDRTGAETLHGESEVGQPVVTRQRLADQARGCAHPAAGLVRIDSRVLKPADRAPALATSALQAASTSEWSHRRLAVAPLVQRVCQFAMPVLQRTANGESFCHAMISCLQTRFFACRQRLVGAVKILRLHADGLCLRFGLNGLLQAHRPFMIELRLGDGVGEIGPCSNFLGSAQAPRSQAPWPLPGDCNIPSARLLRRSLRARCTITRQRVPGR